jgi:hypothetical protein
MYYRFYHDASLQSVWFSVIIQWLNVIIFVVVFAFTVYEYYIEITMAIPGTTIVYMK